MKYFNHILSIALLLTLGLFAACSTDPVLLDDSEPLAPTHTIEQFLIDYTTPGSALTPVRNDCYSAHMIPEDGADIIISGRVVSDDSGGNIYKYITIQDLTNPKIGLKVSIDASGISSIYPIGSIVSIRCNGLVIGRYADMYQLGGSYFNNNNPGFEPGRMPFKLFREKSVVPGLPNIGEIKIDTLTIAQINQAATDRTLHSRIVCIKDVWFNQKSQGAAISSDQLIFAPGTGGIGYPQSRDIQDAAGNTVSIASSEYARFANVKIPTAEYKGTVIAIVGWYKNRTDRAGNVQLTIRSLNDLKFYSEEDGTAWEPVFPY